MTDWACSCRRSCGFSKNRGSVASYFTNTYSLRVLLYVTAVCEDLAPGKVKSDHVSNRNTLAT